MPREDSGPNAGETVVSDRESYARPERAPRRGAAERDDTATTPTAPVAPVATTPAPAAPAPVDATTGAGANMQTYDAATAAAMAGGPAATMERANAAAREEAQRQSDAAVAQAVKAGKTGGLMGGQAALGAQSQAAGAYGTGMAQGQNQYQGYTQLGAQLGESMAGRLSTARGQDIAAKQAEEQARAAKAQERQSLFGNIFGAVGGIASLFSDRRLKENVKEAPSLSDSISKIKSYTFSYRGKDRPEAGVMAQDLERTAMAPAVMDTPEGKMIDTRRLTTMNTATIAEQGDRMKKIEKMIRELKGVTRG